MRENGLGSSVSRCDKRDEGNGMTLIQLKYIVALSKENSINEAAKKLFISQPSLTAALKSLEHEMEKVLFAADELTGLIWAAALMRLSKSTKDMELKSLKKKYKSKGFAAGCSREVIERGAEMLGWELEKLLTLTLRAMAESEDTINEELEQ